MPRLRKQLTTSESEQVSEPYRKTDTQTDRQTGRSVLSKYPGWAAGPGTAQSPQRARVQFLPPPQKPKGTPARIALSSSANIC